MHLIEHLVNTYQRYKVQKDDNSRERLIMHNNMLDEFDMQYCII